MKIFSSTTWIFVDKHGLIGSFLVLYHKEKYCRNIGKYLLFNILLTFILLITNHLRFTNWSFKLTKMTSKLIKEKKFSHLCCFRHYSIGGDCCVQCLTTRNDELSTSPSSEHFVLPFVTPLSNFQHLIYIVLVTQMLNVE